jgi:hypothetical protein
LSFGFFRRNSRQEMYRIGRIVRPPRLTEKARRGLNGKNLEYRPGATGLLLAGHRPGTYITGEPRVFSRTGALRNNWGPDRAAKTKGDAHFQCRVPL